MIKSFIEYINENKVDNYLSTLHRYLKNDLSLMPFYTSIEKELGDTFLPDDFEKEIAYSKGIKGVAGGILPIVQSQFMKMREEVSKLNPGKPKIGINDNSYRDYPTQMATFIRSAKNHGGTIKGALRQAALPGFSQHHTGKSIDVYNSQLLSDTILKKYGFERPYLKDSGFRMSEPWHIYYIGAIS